MRADRNYLYKLLKLPKKLIKKIQSNPTSISETLNSSNSTIDPLNQKVYTKSEDMTLLQLEEVYHNVVLKQNFYNKDYSLDCNIAPYEKLAEILTHTFSPKHHVDIGCGLGLLVKAMRQLRVKSYGIDFSESLINKSDETTKKYLTITTAEDWIQKASLDKVDLVSFTEVFEHLPVSVLEQILKLLHQSYQEKIFLTIPSFGFDTTFKFGIQVNDDNLQWQRDMMENIPFKNIVLENGVPHHGHITLASYRWWTEFFLFHGWSRNRDLEEKCFDNFAEILKLYNWNPYILEKLLTGNELKTSVKTGTSLGTGWHKYHQDEDFEGRWSDGLARVYFFEPEFKPKTLRLTLSAPEVNYIQEWAVLVTLENLVRNRDYKFKWNSCFSSLWHEIPLRTKSRNLEIFVSPNLTETNNDEIASNCWRISLISPNFCPVEYGNSSDSRRLGIVVHTLEWV